MLSFFWCFLLLLLLLDLVGTTSAFVPAVIPSKHTLFRRTETQRTDTAVYSNDPDRVDTTTGNQPTPSSWTAANDNSVRGVDRIEKFARLPVWPAWNGVFIFIVSRLLGNAAAAKLEDLIGGRVCPNFFDTAVADPFIMLVHHRHAFSSWDPLRYIQRSFFPEGFPAHPHRGFVTVTYFLKGGFTHRDSIGIKQQYGAEERHNGKHTQWLTTGAGMLHEEMFDLDEAQANPFSTSSHELYQLWLNVPAMEKLNRPDIALLGEDPSEGTDGVARSALTVVTSNSETNKVETETVVIAGKHQDIESTAPILSDLAILHVNMRPGSVWHHDLPEMHETGILYMRQGSIEIGNDSDGTTNGKTTTVEPHHTAFLEKQGKRLTVRALRDGADFMLLAGQPLREPVSAQGSMVMNTPDQINTAYADYQRGAMGLPWDHKLSDDEWKEHVQRYPSMYR